MTIWIAEAKQRFKELNLLRRDISSASRSWKWRHCGWPQTHYWHRRCADGNSLSKLARAWPSGCAQYRCAFRGLSLPGTLADDSKNKWFIINPMKSYFASPIFRKLAIFRSFELAGFYFRWESRSWEYSSSKSTSIFFSWLLSSSTWK